MEGDPTTIVLGNALAKGLLFVQEMYDSEWSLIETFHQNFPEKYDFFFKRGGKNDSIIFQGSAAESLTICDVTDHHPRFYWHNLRYFRQFDVDVMSLREDIDVLDESVHLGAIGFHLAVTQLCIYDGLQEILKNERPDLKGGGFVESYLEAMDRWKEAKFCWHQKEPLIMSKVQSPESCLPFGKLQNLKPFTIFFLGT